jgi:hypothetical protein
VWVIVLGVVLGVHMQIVIQIVAKGSFILEMEGDDLVETLKQRIEQETGL